MENVKVTRKGNKVEVYSAFLNKTFRATIDNHGIVRCKNQRTKHMIEKALKLQSEGKLS